LRTRLAPAAVPGGSHAAARRHSAARPRPGLPGAGGDPRPPGPRGGGDLGGAGGRDGRVAETPTAALAALAGASDAADIYDPRAVPLRVGAPAGGPAPVAPGPGG